jgi:tRNA (uracil-5-)-methyltransferase TRM9
MNKEYAKYLLEKTRKDYNLIAEEFSSKRVGPWEETRFLFEDYLIPGEKVLDVGCGNGRYFIFTKDKKVDYFGIDSSEKLIQIAKNNYPEGKFQVGDAFNLPFPNNFFDKVYSIAVLHQIPSEGLRLQFLDEVKRILKSRGLMILTVWKFHTLKEYFLILKYTILKLIGKSKLDRRDFFEPWGKKIERYYHCFSKKELKKIVEKSGLKIKQIGVVKNKKRNRQNIYLIAEKPL